MYFVTIRDSIMIAHSLKDEFFGPAQNMHGATYEVDATFLTEELNEHQVVLDIGLAQDLLKEVLAPLAYQNLDELPVFKNKLTTTEFMAKYIQEELTKSAKKKGFNGKIETCIKENPNAFAGFRP